MLHLLIRGTIMKDKISVSRQYKRKCPACNEIFADDILFCPKCGLDMKKIDRERLIIATILIVFGIVCIFLKGFGD